MQHKINPKLTQIIGLCGIGALVLSSGCRSSNPDMYRNQENSGLNPSYGIQQDMMAQYHQIEDEAARTGIMRYRLNVMRINLK